MSWTESTTVDMPKPERISQNLGIITGETNLSEYHQTNVEITDITKYFKTVLCVICGGATKDAYTARWNRTLKSFACYSAEGDDNEPFLEASNTTNIGEINWIAIGTL